MTISLDEAVAIIARCNEGVCLDCGAEAYGVEPDASGYQCESCGEHSVMGMEDAIIDGHIEVTGE
jgi:hypothetical protein